MTSNQTITTSFPLGLFCQATLSGSLPKVKVTEKPAPISNPSRKLDFLTPLHLKIEGLDERPFWED